MKNKDKQVNEMALAVFKRYHGNEPGGGAWTLEHDMRQLAYVERLVTAWNQLERNESGYLEYNAAMDAAREAGETDIAYAHEVRFAYQDVMNKGVTHA